MVPLLLYANIGGSPSLIMIFYFAFYNDTAVSVCASESVSRHFLYLLFKTYFATTFNVLSCYVQ